MGSAQPHSHKCPRWSSGWGLAFLCLCPPRTAPGLGTTASEPRGGASAIPRVLTASDLRSGAGLGGVHASWTSNHQCPLWRNQDAQPTATVSKPVMLSTGGCADQQQPGQAGTPAAVQRRGAWRWQGEGPYCVCPRVSHLVQFCLQTTQMEVRLECFQDGGVWSQLAVGGPSHGGEPRTCDAGVRQQQPLHLQGADLVAASLDDVHGRAAPDPVPAILKHGRVTWGKGLWSPGRTFRGQHVSRGTHVVSSAPTVTCRAPVCGGVGIPTW